LRAWSRAGSRQRSGLGLALALALWIVTIALIHALVVARASSGALSGVARTAYLRSLVFAGQSALEEACYRIRNPTDGGPPPLSDLVAGGAGSGIAADPVATRDVFATQVRGGVMRIQPVMYAVVARPPATRPDDAWLVDLSVEVRMRALATTLARRVRRRYPATICRVVETIGPRAGEVVYADFVLAQDPLLEVVE
jgi:hypothetical protein